MRFLLIFSICLLAHGVSAQVIHAKLKKELDSMYILDQKYRAMMYMDMSKTGDSLAAAFGVSRSQLYSTLWKFQNRIDSANIKRVEAILAQYGYPGKKLVGEPTNEAVFYVVQHSKTIDQYLPLLKKAAEEHELPFRLYAMMLDRSLMQHRKEQIYGTQGQSFQVKDSKTGKMETVSIIWPIQDPEHVNERRKAAGFTQTVEENAKRLNIEYKVLTLEDVNKLQGF